MVESRDGRSGFIPYKQNAARFTLDAFLFKGVTGQVRGQRCYKTVMFMLYFGVMAIIFLSFLYILPTMFLIAYKRLQSIKLSDSLDSKLYLSPTAALHALHHVYGELRPLCYSQILQLWHKSREVSIFCLKIALKMRKKHLPICGMHLCRILSQMGWAVWIRLGLRLL